MLTAEHLSDMTEDQLGEIFSRLAEQYFETPRFGTICAKAMGTSRPTVFRWSKGQGYPLLAILLLQEWLARKTDTVQVHTAALKACETITQLSGVFAKLAEDLNSVTTEARGVPAQLSDA